ncbi:5-demethoxyubiquinone hydroxylase, mitochondrial [Microtus ochrogaster]|uniref:5-demethoxyubiquinone hydroxylase, mitochondrial n=1 Tax=Microtus ochrogaster TaxID=79684 RepID=A0ABM1U4M0_MICOH|nr:5-demethoxyubiquinone hydroxylase, mitochondrial [Microtus ochrogaster]
MSGTRAIAAASTWRLRTGVRRPFSAYGRAIVVRFHSSGMTLDNINRAAVDRIIRVDHAGEYGANRIYAGQMAVLGRSSVGPVIQVGSSLSLNLTCCPGRESEACVPFLFQVIKKFRDEELEHHDTGLDHDAELAPAYALLKRVIQAGCSAAIYLSERF